MTRGKVPLLCRRCRHTESIHIFQGLNTPMPCMARTATGWCPCPDFQEPDPEEPDDAQQRPRP